MKLSTFKIINNQLRRAAILSMAKTIKSLGLRVLVYSYNVIQIQIEDFVMLRTFTNIKNQLRCSAILSMANINARTIKSLGLGVRVYTFS